MKRIGIIVLLILSLALSSCSTLLKSREPDLKSEKSQITQEQGSGDQGSYIKFPAPDFELETLKGDKIKLSDLKGKTVVLNFFATWCPPCKAEMPGFVSTMEEYGEKNKDVVFLFVDVDEDEGTVEQFLKERNYTFAPLMDKGGTVYSKYTLRGGIPTTTIVDKDGNIGAQHEGFMEPGDLKSYIEKVLKK